MSRILKMSLVLTLVLGCVSPLLAADLPRPEKAPLPAFLLAQPNVSPNLTAKSPEGASPFAQTQPQPKWMDDYADCEAACFDGWNQCCTYGGCEQCSCQLALCRAGCGDPYYGC
jgi:hypothetical protein